MDFLGLKTLSIIKEALANIKRTTGKVIDIETIDIDDRKTYDLYCQGNTIGTFQFESTAGMQKYLRELQPSTFEDLIAMNALYRPGPMDYIPDFIARKHGREPIVYDIPEMEKYLKDTYGVTVYQEQVMLLSRLLAGFTRGQSDTLRKAMGKKLIDKMNELEKLFMEGGQANGHKPEALQKIWNDWKNSLPTRSTRATPHATRGWHSRQHGSKPTTPPNTWPPYSHATAPTSTSSPYSWRNANGCTSPSRDPTSTRATLNSASTQPATSDSDSPLSKE